MAVIFASKKSRVYLLSSKPFTLLTDHQSFQYAFQKRDVHGRSARWLDFFAKYGFLSQYRAEWDNQTADYLSQFADEAPPSENEGDPVSIIEEAPSVLMVPKDLEVSLIDIGRYLLGFSIKKKQPETRTLLKRRAKAYIEWDGSLFRRCEGVYASPYRYRVGLTFLRYFKAI